MSGLPIGPRGRTIALVAVIAVAFVGFAVGIDDGVPRAEPGRAADPEPQAVAEGVVPATSYLGLRELHLGRNADFASRPESLTPEAEPPTRAPTAAETRSARSERAGTRAYSGAPPVIPHPVEQQGSDACLSCHQSSVRLADGTANRMPHPYYTNCQQCHVAEAPVAGTALLARSGFSGRQSSGAGGRAWPGAPPTVPHPIRMRTDCLSCHGVHGHAGLRTSHPERANCLQCHAPSAELDQLALGAPSFVDAVPVQGGP